MQPLIISSGTVDQSWLGAIPARIIIIGYGKKNIGRFNHRLQNCPWRRGRLMVSALVPRSSGPGSSPGCGHCVVFLGKTILSQYLSPSRSINGHRGIVGET